MPGFIPDIKPHDQQPIINPANCDLVLKSFLLIFYFTNYESEKRRFKAMQGYNYRLNLFSFTELMEDRSFCGLLLVFKLPQVSCDFFKMMII